MFQNRSYCITSIILKNTLHMIIGKVSLAESEKIKVNFTEKTEPLRIVFHFPGKLRFNWQTTHEFFSTSQLIF